MSLFGYHLKKAKQRKRESITDYIILGFTFSFVKKC